VDASSHPLILVIISANTEWCFVKDYLNPPLLNPSPYGEWFSLHIKNKDFIFFQGGWGKISAAASTQFALSTWAPETVINLGTCGGFAGTSIRKGDLILAESTLVYDIVEQMGDPEQAIQAYTTQLDLSWISIPTGLKLKKTRLISADRDILPKQIPDLINKYNAVAADWESGAIAWVCQKNHIRCLIIRGVTDLVNDQNGEAYGQFDVFVEGTRQVMSPLLDHLPDFTNNL
jgi:adenosylhomocysteine nucleosidase